MEALYIVALHTGLRQGELVRLKWSDLDDDKLSVRGTKNAGSRRVVKLSRTSQDALRVHRERQNEERPSELIFATQTGNQMDRHNLWRQFKRLLKRAKLPGIPFHNLRHHSVPTWCAPQASPTATRTCLHKDHPRYLQPLHRGVR